jgi:hypothetical protein
MGGKMKWKPAVKANCIRARSSAVTVDLPPDGQREIYVPYVKYSEEPQKRRKW